MIYPEILFDGLSDHYLILLGFLISLFFFLKLDLKNIAGVLALLKFLGGVNIKIRATRRTNEAKQWRLSIFFFSQNTSRKATGGSG